ncbi:MAG: heme-binding protein [Spongiibacteraceae bacterium]
MLKKNSSILFALLGLTAASTAAMADACVGLPTHAQLQAALKQARAADNGGFNLDMWGTVVNRSGEVCAVAYTGKDEGAQWPGSRAISAQKANTANAFGLPGLALATANLYSAVQPGGSLFGLQESNPVDVGVAYKGPANTWGKANDPMVGKRIGGVNVFGGGLALYSAAGDIVGAVGVSGDSSCADHAIAWRVRNTLKLDYVPAGVGPGGVDQIAYSGPWSQPHCKDAATEDSVVQSLPATRKKQ